MSTYTPFDKLRVGNLRNDLNSALAEIGERFGVKIAVVGTASFNENLCKFQIEVARIDANGEATSAMAEDFKRYAAMWGMTNEDLGKPFVMQGETFTLIGACPRNRKLPLLAKRASNGTIYKLSVDQVVSQMHPKTKRPDVEILRELRAVEDELSPENVCHDGELTDAQVRINSRILDRHKAALIAELGRTPSDEELTGPIDKEDMLCRLKVKLLLPN